jgi:hypothetical protein
MPAIGVGAPAWPMEGEESMISNARKDLLGALAALALAWIPGCLSEPADPGGPSPEPTRYVDEVRSAFVVAVPEDDRLVTATVSAIGDSAATGYAQTAAGLRAEGVAAPEVDLVFPGRADGARRLHKGGVAIAARLHAAAPSPAEIAGGYVLYRDALGERASIVEQTRADGVEDFFYFRERPPAERIAYELELEAGVGGLRLVSNTLEILDAAGVPRLRVNPPFAVGADGAVVEARLEVARCQVDTSPAIPSSVRTPPGASACEVGLSWTGVTYPALVDPAWVATTSMAYARVFPASSLLDTGRVLVTGGYNSAGALTSAEVYSASTGVWSSTGSMASKRYLHQQVLLATGKVLVAGGLDYASPYVASSEEYDPITGSWIYPRSMATARSEFPLVLVLGAPVAIGGWSASGPLAACEKYDPAAHTWSPFAFMAVPRGGAATASQDAGTFIVSGGYNYASGYLDSSEIYSASVGAFWTGATMTSKRAYHLANPVIGNPRVLVTGGSNTTGYLSTAEVYYGSFRSPEPGSWSAISSMSVGRMRHQAINLAPGRVMACGGLRASSTPNRSCEIFDSLTFGWSPTCDMTAPRDSFTMLVAPSISRTLAAGGYMLSSAELGGCKDRCISGDVPLTSSPGSCEASICAADSYCCTTAWDAICVREVRTICGSLGCDESDGACGHSLCKVGTSLASGCDSTRAGCVASICAADPYCCNVAWNSACINEVASVCGKSCY